MPDHDLDKDAERLAGFFSRKDAMEFQIMGPEPGTLRTWDDLDPIGRENYLKDAQLTLKAIMMMGWGPANVVQHQLLDGLATTIRKDMKMPPAIKRSLTKWFKDLKRQIDAQ